MGTWATAYAPGSTSNLGPGFDCLGIAFTGKGDRVTGAVVTGAVASITGVVASVGGATTPDLPLSLHSLGPIRVGPAIRSVSVSDPRIPTDPARNTAAIAALAVLRRAGSTAVLDLVIEKGLPLSGGMGGSAASAVAGAVAADAVLHLGLDSQALLEAALEAESVVAGRHLDNVAPSLLGGAVLVVGQDPARFARVRVHADLALVLATPTYGVETARARAVLPREVSRADAIGQASSLAGLLLGLERGDVDLIRACLRDRIAEPARASFYPGYAEARTAALEAGALGVVVSGAGPTVVALASPGTTTTVARALADGYARVGLAADIHEARVDEDGARVVARGPTPA